MEILIASNEQSIVTQLRNCLAKAGVDCGHSRVVSHESAQIAAGKCQNSQSVLIFFVSPHLSPLDLGTLNRLCSIGGEQLRVVVVSVNLSAAAILQAVRNGAVDCLSINDNLEGEIRHVLDRVQTASGQGSGLGRLLTIISPVGGTGASVLATNLAAVVARLEQRCALLDLHWRGGDLTTLLNIHPRHTLQSLAGKMDQLDRTMFEHSLVHHDCGVYLLASPEPFSDYRQIRPELIQKIVQLARASFSTVVADLEDCEHHDQARTLAISDRIIVPMRADFVSLVRAKKLLHHLLSSGVNRDHIKLVVRVGRPKELPIGQIEKALEMPICFQLPDDPVAVNEAINLGMPLVINSKHSKTAAVIARLAESLLDSSQQASSSSARPQRSRGFSFPLKTVSRLFGALST